MSTVTGLKPTEDLRAAAHDIANALVETVVGGECYHGGKHTCFTRQGRKPLPLYKVEEMCERCAASWHAVMTATLLDSVVIGQQFLGSGSEQFVLHTQVDGDHAIGATVRGKVVRGKRTVTSLKKPKKPKDNDSGEGDIPTNVNGVAPKPSGNYTPEEREELVKFYQTLPRGEKPAFNIRFHVKAWQMRDWAK